MMGESIEEKFKQKLLRYSTANNGRFSTQTVERIILNSTEDDMAKFLNFMEEDTSGNGMSHIEKEGIMIELAEKYQVCSARELVELYRKSRRF
jgi:hypothetical protein